MCRVSVLIAARLPLVLFGIAGILRAEQDFIVAATRRNGAATIIAIRNLLPDIALLDASMTGPSALEILRAVNYYQLPTRIVFFAPDGGDTSLLMAVAEGAYGVISEDATPKILIESLRRVAAGRVALPRARNKLGLPSPTRDALLASLTERERQVVSLVSSGLSNKEIGKELNLKEGTIKVHLHNVFKKLSIRNRTMLASANRREFQFSLQPSSAIEA